MKQNHNAADLCETPDAAQPARALAQESKMLTVASAYSKHHPDAELLALGERYRDMIAALKSANERCAEVSDRYTDETPPLPPAACVARWDWHIFRDHFSGLQNRIGDVYSVAECEYFETTKITSRRRRRPTDLEKSECNFGKFDRIFGNSKPSLRGQRRAYEILAARADYKISEERRAVRVGLVKALADIDRTIELEGQLNDAIIAAPCLTLEGLAVKAMAMERVHEEFGDPADDYVEPQMMRALCKAVLDVAGVSSLTGCSITRIEPTESLDSAAA